LLLIWRLYVNKKSEKKRKYKIQKKNIGRKSKKYISEKNIPKYPENY
jgi:hypothetical protein